MEMQDFTQFFVEEHAIRLTNEHCDFLSAQHRNRKGWHFLNLEGKGTIHFKTGIDFRNPSTPFRILKVNGKTRYTRIGHWSWDELSIFELEGELWYSFADVYGVYYNKLAELPDTRIVAYLLENMMKVDPDFGKERFELFLRLDFAGGGWNLSDENFDYAKLTADRWYQWNNQGWEQNFNRYLPSSRENYPFRARNFWRTPSGPCPGGGGAKFEKAINAFLNNS